MLQQWRHMLRQCAIETHLFLISKPVYSGAGSKLGLVWRVSPFPLFLPSLSLPFFSRFLHLSLSFPHLSFPLSPSFPSSSLPSLSFPSPFFFLPFPPLPLDVGTPLFQLEGLVECCKLRSRAWGRAPAEIDFGAF